MSDKLSLNAPPKLPEPQTENSLFRAWLKSGQPFIWLNAAAAAMCLVLVLGLVLLIAARGLVHFWPNTVWELNLSQSGVEKTLLGELHESEKTDTSRLRNAGMEVPDDAGPYTTRHLYKIGNRRLNGSDFVWVTDYQILSRTSPEDVYVLERTEWGNFYGRLSAVRGDDEYAGLHPQTALNEAILRSSELREAIRSIEKSEIGAINHAIEQLRLDRRALELQDKDTPQALAEIDAKQASLQGDFAKLRERLNALYADIGRDSAVMTTADGQSVEIRLSDIVQAWQPNAMSLSQKLGHYAGNVWAFLTEEPREANTEGGVFPAIFGTVIMVFIMAILVTPLGVVAAIYLREYASQNYLTRLIRIAVNNLAGVPSIVYGVFGLGFFVYLIGGTIDDMFYPEALPAPTFGTPGLLWASLTLALLTLPVVIVATEEGLTRIPDSIRDGCLALGATRAETLRRVILPMSSPAIMTGLILAIARAAGEVAPLMMVGVVKLAPTLAIDGNAPFLHLDRKFMHLGFHIYDVGFQSPNVEAARPLVYATALLLVLVILVLNLSAIFLRNRLRERYKMLEN